MEPAIGSGTFVDALIHQRYRHLPDASSRQRSMIVDVLLHHGALTQHDIEHHLGLKHGSVNPRLKELERGGVLVNEGPQPRRWTINEAAGQVVGIDFARTRVRVLLADLALGPLGSEVRELAVADDGEAALRAAGELTERLLRSRGVRSATVLGVGAALCGPWDSLRRRPSEYIMPGWRDIDPERRLRDVLHLPVVVDNDANLGALGELTRGAGRGCQHLVYLLATSGIGCGLVLNGSVFRGARGLAGEVGHTIIDRNPRTTCSECGHGCIDNLFSSRDYENELDDRRRAEIAAIPSHERVAYVVHQAVRHNDRAYRGALEQRAETLGLVLANLCTLFSPERAIVGGPVVNGARDIVLDPLREAFRRYGGPGADVAHVVAAGLGDDAEATGAAALVLREPNAAMVERRLRLLDA